MSETNTLPAYFKLDWFKSLKAEIDVTSVTAVALKIGVSRTTLSIFIHGKGLYGSGKASSVNMETRYRQSFEKLTCPHTNEQVGIDHCRDNALRSAPTHNPRQMQQWQACQQCKYKPQPVASGEHPLVKVKETA